MEDFVCITGMKGLNFGILLKTWKQLNCLGLWLFLFCYKNCQSHQEIMKLSGNSLLSISLYWFHLENSAHHLCSCAMCIHHHSVCHWWVRVKSDHYWIFGCRRIPNNRLWLCCRLHFGHFHRTYIMSVLMPTWRTKENVGTELLVLWRTAKLLTCTKLASAAVLFAHQHALLIQHFCLSVFPLRCSIVSKQLHKRYFCHLLGPSFSFFFSCTATKFQENPLSSGDK